MEPQLSASSSSFVATKPPITSECPPTYLVVECTTTSAPERADAEGRASRSVVDHQQRRVLVRDVGERAMETTLSIGLLGVSTHSIFVDSVKAESSASASPRSTESTRDRPRRQRSSSTGDRSRRRRHRPRSRDPRAPACATARLRPASPDAKAIPKLAPSRSDRHASSAARVGLSPRRVVRESHHAHGVLGVGRGEIDRVD